MTLTIEEMKEFVSDLKLPGFVKKINIIRNSALKSWTSEPFMIYVDLGESTNLYREGEHDWRALTNNPFRWPENEDELRVFITTAICHAVLHETVEFVSEGGQQWTNPHNFNYDLDKDMDQWHAEIGEMEEVVRAYGIAHSSPKVGKEPCPTP